MAKVNKTLFDNAESRIKKTVLEGEVAYAVEDGQVFDKAATGAERKRHAQNYAFKFKPALQIKEIKGAKKVKESKTADK
jgi:hypothetical protein